MTQTPHLQVKNLTMAYAETVIQQNIDFSVKRGEIFIIMGGSGCGKSTLLRHLIGLMEPPQERSSLMVSTSGPVTWQNARG
jgi:phospholipid/cholesterol/gamma-HCH transport system ATP-binding protein